MPMTTADAAAVKRTGSRTRDIILALILFFLLAGGIVSGSIWYVVRSSHQFSDLIGQGKFDQARDVYRQTSTLFLGLGQNQIKEQFAQALRAEVTRLTKSYLQHQIKYDKLCRRFDAITDLGLEPDNLKKSKVAADAEYLSYAGDPNEAVTMLEQALKKYPGDPLLVEQLASIRDRVKDLVLYQGPVQHIFFHPLIAYPAMAFDQDYKAEGLNRYFVTVSEFNKIIEALYRNDYILVDIDSVYDRKTVDGKTTLVPHQYWLPRGKKPLIISIDDLNYYSYMLENGMVHKLILDEEGNIATYSLTPDQKPVISRDNEIIPILDQFVSRHPDFSYQGAKGVIALTGFEGVLGYRTNLLASQVFFQEKEQALAVIKRLKETGWSFASHGYGHLNTPAVSMDRLVQDAERWREEVLSLIGPTDVYIFPYGAKVDPGDPKFAYLQQAGFNVFCAVGPREYMRFGSDYVVMDRRHMDGIALLQQTDTLTDLFDPAAVVDPIRPPLN